MISLSMTFLVSDTTTQVQDGQNRSASDLHESQQSPKTVCNHYFKRVAISFFLLYLSFSDCLSISDLVVVREAAWGARNEWYDIGLSLGVSADDLDEIDNDHPRN